MMRLLAVFAVVLFSFESFAFDTVTFITSQDQFTVKKSAQKFTVDGKPVQNDLLVLLQPLLTGKAQDDCPKKLPKAPVTARINGGGKTETRDFFVAKSLVRVNGAGGTQCFFATGDGMMYLPVHRSWLVGPFKESVSLRSPLKITTNGHVVANLIKKTGDWEDTNPKTQLDWDFFEKFEQSMKNYKVQYRVARAAGKGKPWASLESGSERYVFFKVGPKLWAIQRPGNNWLDASGDWSFWFDFDDGVWKDRRVPAMERVEAAGSSTEQKAAAMQELDSSGWSRALEDFYHRRLLDPQEDMKIRSHALERMKSKPSWRNMAAEMQLLQGDVSDELLRDATLALRARNPKGPIYSPGTGDRVHIITEWNEWWRKNSNRKD